MGFAARTFQNLNFKNLSLTMRKKRPGQLGLRPNASLKMKMAEPVDLQKAREAQGFYILVNAGLDLLGRQQQTGEWGHCGGQITHVGGVQVLVLLREILFFSYFECTNSSVYYLHFWLPRLRHLN